MSKADNEWRLGLCEEVYGKPEPPSVHVHWDKERQCWVCLCCAGPVPFEHICSCETDSGL